VFAGLAVAAVLLLVEGTPLEKAMDAFRKGEYGDAVVEAMEVPASDPLYPKAQLLMGEAHLALEEWENAEKAFRLVLKSKPDAVPALAGLGRALTGLEKHTAAMEVLRKAVRLDPKDVGARRRLGEGLAAQGKPQDARKELEQASKIDPKDPLTARVLVEVLVKAGDVGDAAKAAEGLRAADPRSAMGDFLRGLVHDRNGSAKEAIASYEAAIAKDPKFLDAHKNLAILCVADNPAYRDRERTDKALAHFEKYFELGGKDEELRKVYDTMKSFLGSQKGGTPTGK